jgi:hypothetical protein
MRRLALFAVCGWALLGPATAQAATGSVAGTVTPLAWAQEVEVCTVETPPSEVCTSPGADGSYLLPEVPLGQVRIEFVPSFKSGLIRQYYDHKSRPSEATIIVLSKGVPDVHGIDADLVEGGTIEGTATAATGGAPLAEVEACAVSIGATTTRVCGQTDAGGAYRLHSLPTGSYKVGFWGRGKSAEYQPWYYQGKASLAEATPVLVTAGEVTTGIDASLAKGGTIAGSVVAAAGGAPLDGVPVCLFLAAATKPERCQGSAEGGSFSFQGLPSGSYQVGFSLDAGEIGGAGPGGAGDAFATQYFDGVAERARAATIPLAAPATIAGVDAALLPISVPLPPAPPPLAASPIVAAAPPVAEPQPKQKVCRKPKRWQKVKGKRRCVKPAKKPANKKKSHRHRPATARS